MKKKIPHLLTALMVSIFTMIMPNKLVAQQKKYTGWFFLAQNIPLNKKFSFQFDGQFRTDNHWKNAELAMIRPGLTLSLSKKYAVSAGYLLVENWKVKDNVRSNITENRVWQQFSILNRKKSSSFQQKFRFEERWIPVFEVKNEKFVKTANLFNTRLRYSVRYTTPFSTKNEHTQGFYGVLQNEIITNIIGLKNANNQFFDQTRTYAGTGYRINKHTDIEAGYLFLFYKGTMWE